MKEQKEKQSYKVKSVRVHDETWEKLQKKRGDVSWNKFLLNLINNDLCK